MRIGEIISAIERYAPRDFQESWDNTGLQTGSPITECSGVLTCVDCTPEVVEEAISLGCNLIVAHHPLIFKGIKRLVGATPVEVSLIRAIESGISVYSSHTALDSTPGGVSYEMARRLGVTPVRALDPIAPRWVLMSVMVPVAKAEELRLALFDAGCGEIVCGPDGKATGYDCCSFNVDGIGTFRALDGSHPAVGEHLELHHEPETKISMLVSRRLLDRAREVIADVHPYESPAMEVIEMQNPIPAIGLGIVGNLAEPLTPMEFIERVKKTFGSPVVRHTAIADPDVKLRRVAMCGGSGGEFIPKAMGSGAQVYLSSDIRYHDFVDYRNDILIVDIGHFESEQVTKDIFYHIITQKIANFADANGLSGESPRGHCPQIRVYKSSAEKNPINYT